MPLAFARCTNSLENTEASQSQTETVSEIKDSIAKEDRETLIIRTNASHIEKAIEIYIIIKMTNRKLR